MSEPRPFLEPDYAEMERLSAEARALDQKIGTYELGTQLAQVDGTHIWHDRHGDVRIMANVNGWVMARRPHCIPFVASEGDFKLRFLKGRK